MLHSTHGIVLRSVKYGETSLITTIYTQLFGVQSYLVNGVRSAKKSTHRANLFQPSSLVDMVVYHQPNKNLQRIKEIHLSYLYQTIQHNVVKNAVAVYIIELISKTITEPECNPLLYHFLESTLKQIDLLPESELADLPIHFTLELANQLGFAIQYSNDNSYNTFDLVHGCFQPSLNESGMQVLPLTESTLLKQFLQQGKSKNNTERKILLHTCLLYLQHHIPQMQPLKSPEVLHVVLR